MSREKVRGKIEGSGRKKGTPNKLPISYKHNLTQLQKDHIITQVMNIAIDPEHPDYKEFLLFVASKIMPVHRNPCIQVNVPKSLTTIEGLQELNTRVIAQMGMGEISPADTKTIMDITTSQSEMMSKSEFAKKLEALQEEVRHLRESSTLYKPS